MNFKTLKTAVEIQFTLMQSTGGLFRVDTEKDELWDLYLNRFPEGSNPKFRERAEHDCSCCKHFIRTCGNVVAVVGDEVISIWDIDIGGHYQVVADALAAQVKSKPIVDKFYHYEATLGTDHNYEQTEDGMLEWNHFHHKLSNAFVLPKHTIPTAMGDYRTSVQTFRRALEEITTEALEVVLDLIAQNSLYRGTEYLSTLNSFAQCKNEYTNLIDTTKKDIYCWTNQVRPAVAGIRNSAIGSLLTDLSIGVELEWAVKAFEVKVAPSNYKRPTALITKKMIDNAQLKVQELGMAESLQRRYAHTDDLTVNNVLFANRDVRKSMGVFDELRSQVPEKVKLDKVEEVSISEFINNILPTASNIELMLDNRHTNNLVSLIAPVNEDAPNMLKWGNNFSWSYNGEVADSMKERVKKAGGDVTGDLRFSIQWNDNNDCQDDLDAHCYEPGGGHIYYPNKGREWPSSGMLDVDIIYPRSEVAVENITYADRRRMPVGMYMLKVHCYSKSGGSSGFSAEVEFDGQIHSFFYPKPLRSNQFVQVADVTWDGKVFELAPKLTSTAMSKQEWGLNTQQFHSVTMVMLSPNHWNGQSVGNKHWFFMLDGCNNPVAGRGFYNEFLSNDLTEHRKVFEVLGSKMKTPHSNNQLSGLGFSSTKRDSVLCKVEGSFSRVVKINF